MCWSAEVSAGFAAAEWASICYLWWRNQPLDRPFAVALSPIAAQEVVQWFLWNHISRSPSDCDASNALGTLLIELLVCLVPLGWVWFSQRRVSERRWAREFLVGAVLYTALRVCLIGYSFATSPTAQCTTVGPNHHQVWGSFLNDYRSLQPALSVVLLSLYWMLPCGALLLFLRPVWLAGLLCLVGAGTMALSLLLLSVEEFGSVWCWSCSLLVVVALAWPRLLGERQGRG